jgi:hypothetical protein
MKKRKMRRTEVKEETFAEAGILSLSSALAGISLRDVLRLRN